MPKIEIEDAVWKEFESIARSLGRDPEELMEFALKKYIERINSCY